MGEPGTGREEKGGERGCPAQTPAKGWLHACLLEGLGPKMVRLFRHDERYPRSRQQSFAFAAYVPVHCLRRQLLTAGLGAAAPKLQIINEQARPTIRRRVQIMLSVNGFYTAGRSDDVGSRHVPTAILADLFVLAI